MHHAIVGKVWKCQRRGAYQLKHALAAPSDTAIDPFHIYLQDTLVLHDSP